MAQKFKMGDVVKLKSDSPNMTVAGYIEPIDIRAAVYGTPPQDMGEGVIVKCRWFDGKKPKYGEYHEDLLELIP